MASLFDGGYHHLFLSFDTAGDVIAAFVDGNAKTVTTASAGNDGSPDADFSNFAFHPYFAAIDVRGTAGDLANVTLDEAALYGTVLTSAKVAVHAAAVPEPGALGFLFMSTLGLLAVRRPRRIASGGPSR